MPATFTEVLEATKSSKHNAIDWRPVTDNAFDSTAGVLTIHVKRASTAYIVTEFPTSWGRGFTLRKVTKGTDAAAESYSVLCTTGHVQCDCRGASATGACKHGAAVEALLSNHWL